MAHSAQPIDIDRLCRQTAVIARRSDEAYGHQMKTRELEALGEPHIRLGGLRLWVHGRQFPDATDYWDGNWLRVTAHCVYPESTVRAHGAIVHLSEVFGLRQSCARLYETLEGEAALDCMEPNLGVTLKARTMGHIDVRISITPNHMTEKHVYLDTIDQSFLPPLVASCERLLEEYPLREPSQPPSANEDA